MERRKVSKVFPTINNLESSVSNFSERNCGGRHFFGRCFQARTTCPTTTPIFGVLKNSSAEAQRFVYEQKGKIIRSKTAGINTSDAERMLQIFEKNLRMFEEHRIRFREPDRRPTDRRHK